MITCLRHCEDGFGLPESLTASSHVLSQCRLSHSLHHFIPHIRAKLLCAELKLTHTASPRPPLSSFINSNISWVVEPRGLKDELPAL